MVMVRRARNFIVYLAALFISGLFAFWGRSGPVWAEDAKVDHSAKVFHESFRVAQFQIENRNRVVEVNRIPLYNARSWDQFFGSDGRLIPAIEANAASQREEIIKKIQDKLEKNSPLDIEEIGLLQSIENARQIELLRQQLNSLQR